MTDEFVEYEKEAKELVGNLKKLMAEVKGYKTSKEELTDLNKTLSGFIDETKKLTEKSATVIENTSKLTPSKIDKKVDDINKRIDAFETLVNKTVDHVEKMEKSLLDHMSLLAKAVELNTEAIKNKRFNLFGK